MKPLESVTLDEIRAAQERIADLAIRTPLVRLQVDDTPAEIWLKLENLQPIGSFKLRGAGNAMRLAGQDRLQDGVYTASAGNMAQGVAYVAREMGIDCGVVVPEHAPRAKLDAIERLQARIVKVPFDEWWEVLMSHHYDSLPGQMIHPVADRRVIAGNGTIGLEIVEALGDVDTVIVPYGGGALSCGIASAVKALKPDTTIFASEIDTAAPLSASLAAGEPLEIDYTASFVDGIGGKGIMPEMWPLTRKLLAGSVVVSLKETARALRLMAERNRVIAEGAGATSVAAALSGRAGPGKIACVVSGGNIDAVKLATILGGGIP